MKTITATIGVTTRMTAPIPRLSQGSARRISMLRLLNRGSSRMSSSPSAAMPIKARSQPTKPLLTLPRSVGVWRVVVPATRAPLTSSTGLLLV